MCMTMSQEIREELRRQSYTRRKPASRLIEEALVKLFAEGVCHGCGEPATHKSDDHLGLPKGFRSCDRCLLNGLQDRKKVPIEDAQSTIKALLKHHDRATLLAALTETTEE